MLRQELDDLQPQQAGLGHAMPVVGRKREKTILFWGGSERNILSVWGIQSHQNWWRTGCCSVVRFQSTWKHDDITVSSGDPGYRFCSKAALQNAQALLIACFGHRMPRDMWNVASFLFVFSFCVACTVCLLVVSRIVTVVIRLHAKWNGCSRPQDSFLQRPYPNHFERSW